MMPATAPWRLLDFVATIGQSAGRAAVAEITPPGQQGEVFGLWGFAGKFAGIVGPLAFGALAGAVGLREAVLVNAVWFGLGAWILGRR